jgi:hypothetical protein
MMTEATKKLISLGRFMLEYGTRFRDDELCNTWCRVEQMLVELGMPFSVSYTDILREEYNVIFFAASVMAGKIPAPETVTVTANPLRQTRSPRMRRYHPTSV